MAQYDSYTDRRETEARAKELAKKYGVSAARITRAAVEALDKATEESVYRALAKVAKESE